MRDETNFKIQPGMDADDQQGIFFITSATYLISCRSLTEHLS